MAKHGKVKDSGEYFAINPASRKVTVPHVHKSIGTVGDHNSEQITFECPQMIDGHDISQCASRYVTWINVNGEVGHDELQIAEVEQGKEGMLYLSWTIRNGLTVAKGIVQFSVHFEDFDEDGETLYRWSTATCKDCDILDSVNAVLGAYQAIYVAGDTLVIEDYTLVKDGVLELKTNGLVPEGTLKIEANGKFDVGKYAEVDIAVNDVEMLSITCRYEGGVADFEAILSIEYVGYTKKQEGIAVRTLELDKTNHTQTIFVMPNSRIVANVEVIKTPTPSAGMQVALATIMQNQYKNIYGVIQDGELAVGKDFIVLKNGDVYFIDMYTEIPILPFTE
jgi:hypothetical protein